MINVECIKTGYLEENCYVLEIDGDALIVDPGDDYEKILSKINKKNVLAILITHHHFDHVGELDRLVEHYKCKVIDYYDDNESFEIGGFSFIKIENLGHSSDSVSYYFKKDKMMFCGDFIFKGSIGRCDLEGGDFNKMLKSLDKVKKINSDITLYPGHGDKTTLEYELINNPYLKGDNYE